MRVDHPASEMSPADRAAHEDASHVTWGARENYLRNFGADGRIVTDMGKHLVDEIGEWPFIEVTVESVSPAHNGVVYAIVRDGFGTAILVLNGRDHAEACEWMGREVVRLVGKAVMLFGQPGLDLRRAPSEPLPVEAQVPAGVHRAAVRFGIVTARIAELEAMDACHMSPGEFDALLDAQNELVMRRKQLADAGRLDLIGVTA